MRRDSFWFPFEPNRWLANEKLALVSLASKGLWIHLLCLMYKANAGGKLTINGHIPTPEQISRMVGQDAKPLLQELEVAGVYELKDGAIYHGGVASGLAKMEERSAGYARRMNHRSPIYVPSMNHLCTKDEPSIVYNNSNSNSNNNSKIDNKKEREGLRPTLAEWIAFAKEIGWRQTDAESAFDYYQSNGWKVGGKASVKDWRACARNCQRRSNQQPTKGNNQQMKKPIKSGCESPPTYKLAGFNTHSDWVEAGCP
jgi:hypothetical protein